MQTVLIAFALLAGAMVPFQAAANARQDTLSGHPAWGALVNILGAPAGRGGALPAGAAPRPPGQAAQRATACLGLPGPAWAGYSG